MPDSEPVRLRGELVSLSPEPRTNISHETPHVFVRAATESKFRSTTPSLPSSCLTNVNSSILLTQIRNLGVIMDSIYSQYFLSEPLLLRALASPHLLLLSVLRCPVVTGDTLPLN